jgi:N-acetylmuramoyl-L-alanine amidase
MTARRNTVQLSTRIGLTLFCMGLPFLAAAASVSVKDLRLAADLERTRVVLELSEPIKQKIFTLDNPSRVVIDLPAAHLTAPLPVGEGVVKSFRAAQRDNGDLRIVLDVTARVRPQARWIEANSDVGPRLVLDLTQPGPVKDTPPPPPAAPKETTAINVSLAAAPTPTAAVNSPDPIPFKSSATSAGSRDLIIAIDAGHGGEDPGAIGNNGVREKNVTLAIARQLKERIDNEPGMRAVLTRDGDYFVPLRDRINRARQFQADMFVSIHADSVRDSHVTGSSVYTLSPKGATNEAARWLADRENSADMVGGVSLEDKNNLLASVLLDLTQRASMSASMDAAARVLKQLDGMGSVHHSMVQQAGFVVLKSPDIPSMLVETAFISNPIEEARLNDAQHQARLATAILAGVRDYFYTNTPPNTRLAQLKATRQARND